MSNEFWMANCECVRMVADPPIGHLVALACVFICVFNGSYVRPEMCDCSISSSTYLIILNDLGDG